MQTDKTGSIDKILLEKGLISPAQLTTALEYICRLPRSQEMTLAEVLIAFEYVTQDEIDIALGNKPPVEDVLVQMLVKSGMIDPKQVKQAAENLQSNQNDKRLGTMLYEMGYTTREIIETALKDYYQKTPAPKKAQDIVPEQPQTNTPEPRNTPLGQLLIEKGYINQTALQEAIDYQYRLPRLLHKPLGEILVLLGYINETELQEVLQEQKKPSKHNLGETLVSLNIIKSWQLSHAMTLLYQPDHSHKKLGDLLVELGYASAEEIKEALKKFFKGDKAA